MFPIFYGESKLPQKVTKISKNTHIAKKFRALAPDQMLLDAGQKNFGLTQCTECSIVYHQGDPSEELMHFNYHNAGAVFRFHVRHLIISL